MDNFFYFCIPCTLVQALLFSSMHAVQLLALSTASCISCKRIINGLSFYKLAYLNATLHALVVDTARWLQGVLDLVAAELEQEEELRAQHARDKKQVGHVPCAYNQSLSKWASYTVARISVRFCNVHDMGSARCMCADSTTSCAS